MPKTEKRQILQLAFFERPPTLHSLQPKIQLDLITYTSTKCLPSKKASCMIFQYAKNEPPGP